MLSSKTSVPYKSDVCTQRNLCQQTESEGEGAVAVAERRERWKKRKRRFAHLRKLAGRLCAQCPVTSRPVARSLASVELVRESGLDTETSPDGRSESAHVRVHTRDSSNQEVLEVRSCQL